MMTRCSRSYFDLSAQVILMLFTYSLFSFFLVLLLNEDKFFTNMCGNCQVIEVAPAHCVIEISKSAGDLRMYNKVRKHPVS